MNEFTDSLLTKGSRKRSSSTNGQAIKRGGGLKAGPLRKTFFFVHIDNNRYFTIRSS